MWACSQTRMHSVSFIQMLTSYYINCWVKKNWPQKCGVWNNIEFELCRSSSANHSNSDWFLNSFSQPASFCVYDQMTKNTHTQFIYMVKFIIHVKSIAWILNTIITISLLSTYSSFHFLCVLLLLSPSLAFCRSLNDDDARCVHIHSLLLFFCSLRSVVLCFFSPVEKFMIFGNFARESPYA